MTHIPLATSSLVDSLTADTLDIWIGFSLHAETEVPMLLFSFQDSVSLIVGRMKNWWI